MLLNNSKLQTLEPVADLRRFIYHNALSRLIKFDAYQKEIEAFVLFPLEDNFDGVLMHSSHFQRQVSKYEQEGRHGSQ